MIKNLFLISCTVLALAGLPYYAQNFEASLPANTEAAPANRQHMAASVQPAPAKPVAHYASGVRAATIPMDKNGHFSADFQINGRYARGLIDTGATYVALNQSTARGFGITLANSDFKHQVRTANGPTRAALVIIDRMEVGSISVKDVKAFVLDDTALTATLIGMSFMSKLQSYRVKDNRLELIN